MLLRTCYTLTSTIASRERVSSRSEAMICIHVKKLYQLCESEGLKLSSSDLVHIVCEQCGVKEVCPAVMSGEYDANEATVQEENNSSLVKKKGAGGEPAPQGTELP